MEVRSGSFRMNFARDNPTTLDMYVNPSMGSPRRHLVYLNDKYADIQLIMDDKQIVELRDRLVEYAKRRGIE